MKEMVLEKESPDRGLHLSEKIITQKDPYDNEEFYQQLTAYGGEFFLIRFTKDGTLVDPWTGKNEITPNNDCYYTVNPRVRYNGNGQGKKEDIRYATAFFADIDYGTDGHKKLSKYKTREEALRAIDSFPLLPTYIIHTGHGYQCLWLFKEQIEIGKDIGLDAYEAMNRNIQTAIGADTTPDVGRLLRLPGSFNVKNPANPVPVKIVKNNDVQYALGDFEMFETDGQIDDEEKDDDPPVSNLSRLEKVSTKNLPERLRRLLKEGLDIDDPDQKDRSVLIHRCTFGLKAKGYTDDEVFTLLTDPKNKLSEKLMEMASDRERKRYVSLSLKKAKEGQYNSLQEITRRHITTDELRSFLEKKGFSFQKNELTWEIEVIKDGKNEPISDGMAAEIRNLCRDEGILNIGMVNDFILAEAEKNKRNPIKEYFESLTPGTLTIDGFVDRYLKLSPVEEYDGILDVKKYFKIFFKKWLIGAILRAFTGTHNVTLVIEGKQGIGKSRFVKWLAPTLGKDIGRLMQLYVSSSISPDSKDAAILSTLTLLWEIAEFGATSRRADVEALKAFLSREKVDERPAYGKYNVTRTAIANFIATVNNENGFLNDPTGNRRFISFSFDRIDTTFENESPDSLWYEAYQAYMAGETPFYIDEEKRIQASLNRQYERESALLPMIEELFDFTGKESDFLSTVTIESAVADYIKNHASWLTVKNMDREIKVILEKKGAKKHRMSKGGQRGYQGIVRKKASTSSGYSGYR